MLFVLAGCKNPFAPSVREGDLFEDILGNPRTVEGFFTRFQNAYQLRDTTLYGPLIHPEFRFTFRDFEQNVDVAWGRNQELTSTFNMFAQTREIQLTWNNIVAEIVNTDNNQAQIIRRFNLALVLDNSDILRTDGSANFVLERSDSLESWQVIRWRDESDL